MSFPQLHLTQPHRKVNWGRLADANVDSITRRGDIHSVLSFADDVTYGEPGELDPNFIHTPGVFVQRIFQGKAYEKRIEQRTVRNK